MLDRGVVAPLDEGTTLLLADPSLVAASIVARLPETLCCCRRSSRPDQEK